MLAVRLRTLPSDHPDLLDALNNLAVTRAELGDIEGARARQHVREHPPELRAALIFEAADAVVAVLPHHPPALPLGVRSAGLELRGHGEVAVGLLLGGAAPVDDGAEGAGVHESLRV